MLSVYEITKKTPKSKGYYKDKMGKNQKKMQIGHSVKSKNGQHDEQCWEVNSVRSMNSARRNFLQLQIFCIFCYSFLLVFDLQC